jgi:hypothetical protein
VWRGPQTARKWQGSSNTRKHVTSCSLYNANRTASVIAVCNNLHKLGASSFGFYQVSINIYSVSSSLTFQTSQPTQSLAVLSQVPNLYCDRCSCVHRPQLLALTPSCTASRYALLKIYTSCDHIPHSSELARHSLDSPAHRCCSSTVQIHRCCHAQLLPRRRSLGHERHCYTRYVLT